MTVRNNSTNKNYIVSKEEYERTFKGKENWTLVDEKEKPKDQLISNTISGPKTVEPIVEEKGKVEKKTGGTKKSNSKTQK